MPKPLPDQMYNVLISTDMSYSAKQKKPAIAPFFFGFFYFMFRE
jgi:hypothetical protein